VQVGRHIFYRLPGSLGAPRIFTQRYAGPEPMVPNPSELPLVIASPDIDRLVNGLISDAFAPESPGTLTPLNPNLIAPNSPLVADRVQSPLIADSNREPPASMRPKAAKHCTTAGNDKRLRPMKAESLSAGVGSNC
jgi:hypothetical protein